MRNTVTISLLKTIIANYPEIPSHLVHSAGMDYCLSGGQRLRELKKAGVIYTYKDHKYNFADTPPLILYSLLKEREG